MAVIIARTHFAYARRDGQAELADTGEGERVSPELQPGRPVVDLPTPEGWSAELSRVLLSDGLPVCRQSPIHVVTEPGVEQVC